MLTKLRNHKISLGTAVAGAAITGAILSMSALTSSYAAPTSVPSNPSSTVTATTADGQSLKLRVIVGKKVLTIKHGATTVDTVARKSNSTSAQSNSATPKSSVNDPTLVTNEFAGYYTWQGYEYYYASRWDDATQTYVDCVVADNCISVRPARNKKRAGFVAHIPSPETQLFAYGYQYANCGSRGINDEWDGSFLTTTAKLRYRGDSCVTHVQNLSVGVQDSAFGLPPYYGGGK